MPEPPEGINIVESSSLITISSLRDFKAYPALADWISSINTDNTYTHIAFLPNPRLPKFLYFKTIIVGNFEGRCYALMGD